MKRRVVGVGIAVMLALVGTFVLVAYVNTAEDRALAGERTVDVLVVSEPVEKGTAAVDLDGSVTIERVPAKVRAQDAVADLKKLGKKVTSVALSPGEQVTAARFVDPSELNQVGQVAVPDGLLQVTLALSAERTVGGRVEPGATVAVIASFDSGSGQDGAVPTDASTYIVTHKALVTNVQGALPSAEDQSAAPDGGLLVTLALTGAQVEQVVHTAEFGSVWLAFEPSDAPNEAPVVTQANVYQAL